MFIKTNRATYFVRGVHDNRVVYDVLFNPKAETTFDLNEKQIVGVSSDTPRDPILFRVASLKDFTLKLAVQGVYFAAGREVLKSEGYHGC